MRCLCLSAGLQVVLQHQHIHVHKPEISFLLTFTWQTNEYDSLLPRHAKVSFSLANHNRRRQFSEPMTTRSKLQVVDVKSGKTHKIKINNFIKVSKYLALQCMRVICDWFGFTSDWLIKWRKIFLANHKA